MLSFGYLIKLFFSSCENNKNEVRLLSNLFFLIISYVDKQNIIVLYL